MLSASFGVLSQNTGFYPSLDRIIETTLGPLNLGPRGGSYNKPISRLHRVVRRICFHHHPEVWGPVAKYWGCGECVLQSLERSHFPLSETPRCGLLAQIRQWEGHL